MNVEMCVTMNVVSEFELVKASLTQIQRVYPNARVVLLVDSDVAAVVDRWLLFAGSNTQVRQTAGVYQIERGGLVVSEHLLSFLSTDADWWFKMDPDTCVRHTLGSVPDSSYFF